MVTAAPQSPTREEKLQQQLAEQLQLPGLDTSAPARPQPPLEQAKVYQTLMYLVPFQVKLKQLIEETSISLILNVLRAIKVKEVKLIRSPINKTHLVHRTAQSNSGIN